MTGENLERVTELGERPPIYRCTECGGESNTRMPWHHPLCPVIADQDLTGGDGR